MEDYQITFRIAPFLGTWTWSAVTPDGRQLNPLGFGFASKEAAESNALRQIEQDRATESISGQELARRVDLRGYYRSYRGESGLHESGLRKVVPLSVRYGTSEHHTKPQWLLECWDVDRQAPCTYALGTCDFDQGYVE